MNRKGFEENFDLNDPDIISVLDELPLWSAPFGITLLDTVQMKKNATILDIGCGTGFPLIELAQRFGTGSRVYGLDPWQNALDRVKSKLKICGIPNVILINETAEKMSFESHFFDLIVSNNGLNNVEDPRKVVSECFRVSKGGSQMVVTMNLPESMGVFYKLFEAVLKENGMTGEIDAMKNHIDQKRKPVSFTRSIIEKAGFRIKKIIKKSFDLRFMDGTALFNHFFIRLAFLPSWKNIVSQKDRPFVFRQIEERLNRFAAKTGALRLNIPYICIDSRKEICQ